MGIIVHKQTNQHNELDDRIAASLRARAVQSLENNTPDLVADSDYTQNLQKTNRFAWVWLLLIGLALLSLVFIIIL